LSLFGPSLFRSDISIITTLSHSILCYLYFLHYYYYYIQRGRRGGGGAPARRPAAPSRPASRPASTSARTPAPQQSSAAAPAKSGGMLSGIGSTIAQGMAFGTGSAIAHQAVGAVAGSFGGGGSKEAEQQEQAPMPAQGQGMNQQDTGACSNDKSMFYDCLNHNKGDQQSCTFLYEQLQQCQQHSSQSSSQMQF
jgi:hypothetical protein